MGAFTHAATSLLMYILMARIDREYVDTPTVTRTMTKVISLFLAHLAEQCTIIIYMYFGK